MMQADLSLNLPHKCIPMHMHTHFMLLHHGDTIDEIDEEPHHLSQSARSRLLGVSGRSRSIARCRQLDDPSTYVVAFFSDRSFFSGTFSGELSALFVRIQINIVLCPNRKLTILSLSVRRTFDYVSDAVCLSVELSILLSVRS